MCFVTRNKNTSAVFPFRATKQNLQCIFPLLKNAFLLYWTTLRPELNTSRISLHPELRYQSGSSEGGRKGLACGDRRSSTSQRSPARRRVASDDLRPTTSGASRRSMPRSSPLFSENQVSWSAWGCPRLRLNLGYCGSLLADLRCIAFRTCIGYRY